MKFSDALRGAADRAPVDGVQVSTSAATSRIKRGRAWRMGANGVAGVGAAAVIAFAALGPLGAGADDMMMADAVTEQSAPDGPTSAMEESAGDMDDGASATQPAPQWMCGTDFDPSGTWAWGDSSGVTFTADQPQVDGNQVWLPSTLTVSRPVDLLASGSDYVVTWEGTVVGRYVNPDPIQYGPADEPMLPEGQVFERLEPGTDSGTLEQSTVLDPVNCWDGEPLPAGDYQVHQAWTLAYADTAAGSEGPTLDGPADGPADGPSDSGSSGLAPGSDAADQLPGAGLEQVRVAADPVTLTIEGEPVDHPFSDYLDGNDEAEPLPLPEPIEPRPGEPLPDGHLTVDQARELFEANVSDSAWDMAAGTQRWVKTHDSQDAPRDEESRRNFFGCAWGDGQGSAFPQRSAPLDLLDVDIQLPERIGVSYGFVVDGNPKVTSTVTNSSQYAIPGMWAGAQPQLYLVQDGTVVASASPQSIERGEPMRALDSPAQAFDGDEPEAVAIAPDAYGALEPGDSLSGEYLWRDVNSCDRQRESSEVTPGTYTVLTVYSVSISHQQQGAVQDVPAPEPGLDQAPPPTEWDSVELQGWTSLGTVTVS